MVVDFQKLVLLQADAGTPGNHRIKNKIKASVLLQTL
jgi:hypothetical protein